MAWKEGPFSGVGYGNGFYGSGGWVIFSHQNNLVLCFLLETKMKICFVLSNLRNTGNLLKPAPFMRCNQPCDFTPASSTKITSIRNAASKRIIRVCFSERSVHFCICFQIFKVQFSLMLTWLKKNILMATQDFSFKTDQFSVLVSRFSRALIRPDTSRCYCLPKLICELRLFILKIDCSDYSSWPGDSLSFPRALWPSFVMLVVLDEIG